MNNKYVLTIALFAWMLAFTSCEKGLNSIGGSVQPDGDVVKLFVDTFSVNSNTFKVDSIYSKTPKGLLGIFDDPMFGELTADYMAQFYIPEDFYFSKTLVDNRIDSVMMRLYYGSFVGDSLNPMEVSVYELDKKLDRHFYTNVDPSTYCNESKLLGKTFYTAKNYAISDSDKEEAGNYPFVQMKMPGNLAERVLTPDFPQIYVKNSYGRGTLLQVDYTDIIFFFKERKTLKDQDGKDSIITQNATRVISVTKEVLQLNRIKNDIPDDFLIANDTATFLKTPAGLFTEFEFPYDRIMEKLKGKTINAIKFNVPAYRPYASKFATTQPKHLLFVQKSKINEFFETKTKPDNKTSFVATLDSTRASIGSGYSYHYDFSNIAPYMDYLFEQDDLKDGMKIAILPISAEVDKTSGAITRVRSLMYPTAVMLKKGNEKGRVSVIYSDF